MEKEDIYLFIHLFQSEENIKEKFVLFWNSMLKFLFSPVVNGDTSEEIG